MTQIRAKSIVVFQSWKSSSSLRVFEVTDKPALDFKALIPDTSLDFGL